MTRRQWAKSLLGLVVVPVAVLGAVIVWHRKAPLGQVIGLAVLVAFSGWVVFVLLAHLNATRTRRLRSRFPGSVVVNCVGMPATGIALRAIGGSPIGEQASYALVFDASGLTVLEGFARTGRNVTVGWDRIRAVTQGSVREELRGMIAIILVIDAAPGQGEAPIVMGCGVVTDFFGAADEYWLRDRIREIEAIRPASSADPEDPATP